jgi:hypothetical protein
MSLESTLTQDNGGANYTVIGALANPPETENLVPNL